MKNIFILAIAFCCLIGYGSCTSSQNSSSDSHKRPGIPAKAQFADENDYYEVYVNEEAPAKDRMDVAKVSIWLYNKSTKKSSKLLTTVKPESFWWYQEDGEKGIDFPIDSITAVHKIIPVDSTTLIVEGCPDNRNEFTYIIDIPNRKATYLPFNSGIIGFTSEEGLIIGQSYRYVSDPDIAGRYSYIQIFDWDGNQIADLDLEREHLKRGVLNLYLDFQPKTKLNLKSYEAESDFRFPVEGEQNCWEYVYTFDTLAPEDISALNRLVATDKEWAKVGNGYKYTHIDKNGNINIQMFFDLKNKQLTLVHGFVENDTRL